MQFSNIEAAREVLLGLIKGNDDITALKSGKYLTTRITNIIMDLRDTGLKIETKMVKSRTGKRFGVYKLESGDDNYKKAYEVLEIIEGRLANRNRTGESA